MAMAHPSRVALNSEGGVGQKHPLVTSDIVQ